MRTIEEDIERILISEKDIKKAVKKMGKQTHGKAEQRKPVTHPQKAIDRYRPQQKQE